MAANGFTKCEFCRHFRPVPWPDPQKIDRGLCKRFPPETKETASPDAHVPMSVPLPSDSMFSVIVVPILPAIVMTPEGPKKIGLGSSHRVVFAIDECGEFEAKK